MGEVGGLSAPVPLEAGHECEEFESGEATLDEWLRKRALANQMSGATRTYVVRDGVARVVGYYALASGAVVVAKAGGRFRRNMPDPIPVVVLARLAVDRGWQGKGLGRGLFRDAAQRVVQAADVIGIRALVVHAISMEARQFYVGLGLVPSPLEPMTLMVTVADLRAVLD